MAALTSERLWQEFLTVPPPWPPNPDAGPWCGCCLHITRLGDDKPRRVPSAYTWATMDGLEIPLCVSCCASWRENATMDPSLLPARICSL
jgi:hypothetical protein